ncbi:type VI secretion system tube protein Hcp [Acidisphaera sp. L21]|jgi:type VI secretion system secreted protein Hcp|uniref:Hcp family type VI secretion system effector n=1 Tax=Acidisphaera sp. L21 TaxID=1641851 RepID=UPI00131BD0D9|nr:type VI secretion system tube protein Hcp [Acidisphaera sp. L21]
MAIYMKFGDIKGRVATEGFKEWIELMSFQHGVGRAVTSGSGGKQREGSNPEISEVVVTKVFDDASSKLYQDALAGSFDTKVEFKFTTTTKNKIDTYLAYELKQCGVSSYSMSSGGDNPMESLSLNFTNILVSPSPLDDKGSPKAGPKVGYDLMALKAS